jgi:hypothetical protein
MGIGAHVQETPLVFFHDEGRQAASRIRDRVNSNPIGAHIWDCRRRVAA